MKGATGAEALLAGVVARIYGAAAEALTEVGAAHRAAASEVQEAVGNREGEYYFSNNCAYKP